MFILKAYNFAKYILASYQSHLFYPILRGLETIVHSKEVKKTLKMQNKNYYKN